MKPADRMAEKPPTIFINPKFKNAHINPNFIKGNNSIHVNPKFFVGIPLVEAPPAAVPREIPRVINNAIVRNTRRTLIRAGAASRPQLSQSVKDKAPVHPQHQLIKISKNKLVTAAHLMKCQQKENEIIKRTTETMIKTRKLARKNEAKQTVYKLDRRLSPIAKKKKTIVSTYSLRRVDAISPQKVIVSDRKLLKT